MDFALQPDLMLSNLPETISIKTKLFIFKILSSIFKYFKISQITCKYEHIFQ